jgi:regulator of sirC expression with transglutaminase-like and TPR domain
MTVTPLDYFSSLVLHDHSIPLFEAALALGQDTCPNVDLEGLQNVLDQYALTLNRQIDVDASHVEKLRTLNRYFFKELGFAGNINNYYDPDNSYLHCVLATRRGIPISLAIIYMELANQIGLAITGVSFPGHFLVKLTIPSGEIVLDPLNGQSLSKEILEERLAPFVCPDEYGNPTPLSVYLRAAHPREILTRMLRNLKFIYQEKKAWGHLLDVQKRLVILLPDDIVERRDRGIAYSHVNASEEALNDLEAYLAIRPQAHDANSVAQIIDNLKSINKH